MINERGFTFYPKAWLNNKKLEHCSLQAKGLWIDLICHMHDGEPYGYLVFNGKVLTPQDVQHLVKVSDSNVFNSAWNELLEKNIIAQNQKTGAFYSKRMTEEHGKQERTMHDIKKLPLYSIAEEIMAHLNQVSGKNLPLDLKAFECIEKWYQKGHGVKDFKIVNEIKTAEWKDEPNMVGWIRPTTLYGDKFLNYLNQIPNYKLKGEVKKKQWEIENYFLTQHNNNNSNNESTESKE